MLTALVVQLIILCPRFAVSSNIKPAKNKVTPISKRRIIDSTLYNLRRVFVWLKQLQSTGLTLRLTIANYVELITQIAKAARASYNNPVQV